MKKHSLPAILILFLAGFISSCSDDCGSQLFYTYPKPVYMTTQEIREGFDLREPSNLSFPGKIYMYNNYLFINELGQGIHIINNTDRRNPVNVSFINIPGNFDMAVKDNILFADSYVDLLAIDITDVNDIQLIKRLEGVFDDHYHYDFLFDGQEAVVVDFVETDTVWYDDPDCDAIMPSFLRFDIAFGAANDMAIESALPPSASNIGLGGSMARFAVVNEILYTVGSYNLGVFDISTSSDPIPGNKVHIGWNIETIFPYGNNLFIGAQNGMYIYDISEPSAPEYMSTFEHVTSCDPVVVNDEYAFVTLRSGTECMGYTNQLDVIDINNLYNPKLVKTYPMENPHGLGLDGSILFICEGDFGLKVFEASDIEAIDQNLLKYYKEMHAYDVIPYNNNLIMIGMDGLYQYDYSSIENIELLSHLPILRVNE